MALCSASCIRLESQSSNLTAASFKFNVFLRLRNSVNLRIALLGMDEGGNCKYLKHKRQDLNQKASSGAI